jgi:23S rRNA (cytidine1920-2'-O)/16S rRNA (cytidine1409-2'-O)-methyltransferase
LAPLSARPSARYLREATDIRALGPAAVAGDLVVCDPSFVLLRIVLQPAFALARSVATLVVLIKPQFEVGRAALKKSLVRDPDVHAAGTVPSPIADGDGNREFLLGARRRAA